MKLMTMPLSRQARQLLQHVRSLIQAYETSLGAIPVWINEIEPDQALRLLATCQRIGLRLPPQETLQVDTMERKQAQQGAKLRGRAKD